MGVFWAKAVVADKMVAARRMRFKVDKVNASMGCVWFGEGTVDVLLWEVYSRCWKQDGRGGTKDADFSRKEPQSRLGRTWGN
jgi:hypothetical protein